jgi:hypothetical protein
VPNKFWVIDFTADSLSRIGDDIMIAATDWKRQVAPVASDFKDRSQSFSKAETS